MEVIILPDDELGRLEEQCGRGVRQMGAWNSDGVFGYCSVPVAVVEIVARESNNPVLLEAVSHLRNSSERGPLFVELLQAFGPPLVEQIATAYRVRALDLLHAGAESEQKMVMEWQTA